ncbi:MAG: TonB-dependent receptor [Bacteroidetes bacterium]|nr:MAG: TonB-dependent receptor [Bacteroidota bacterium]
MKRTILLTSLLFSGFLSFAQTTARNNSADSSSVDTLREVIIRAFEQNRKISEVAAPIGWVGPAQLTRFNNMSLLSAVNTIPGVRMEERSPASYRLNFRGSTLRSPFGVRNVKVYLNGIPFTDPGGNTYLNQLSFYHVQSLEIVKGPASSLYGAGTGGAVLIRSQPETWQPGFSAGYIFGSYNMSNFNAQIRLGGDETRNIITYAHQNCDGYRDHTNMRRDLLSWETQLKSTAKQTLNTYFSYGDLYYQTPGALNKTEYAKNPRAARPAVGTIPSAEQAQAAIFQKTFLVGISNTWNFDEHWQNTTSVYGAYTQLKNPTFRNYEIRNEPHFGGRSLFTYKNNINNTAWQVSFGAEAQKGFFKTEDYGNLHGQPDTIQVNDNINTWLYSIFAQLDLRFAHGWGLTAGASLNKSFIGITQLTIPGSAPQNVSFNNEIAPRLAISKKIIPELLAYASVSKGFSPPTVAEVLPSTSVINTSLQAEHGIDYELGLKSTLFNQRLYIEANAFYFQLENAIVVRKDTNNADYYVNAGATKQQGLESQASYQLFEAPGRILNSGKIWVSYTLNNFTYQDFKKNTVDYTGKKLPGVANNTVAAGLDLFFRFGLYMNITYYYSDRMPLNDANNEFGSSYNLLGTRIGYRMTIDKRFMLDIFAGGDNLFNTKYSLGNDINAAAGRFYNAAPGVNYFAGLSLNYLLK